MNKLLIVAGKEFTDGFRNRWVIAMTLIFAMLSLGLAYFGAAASGVLGFTSLDSTVISLASLAVVLIPLIALMLSYNAFVGEYEQGTMLLLLTYPLSRGQLLIGKFIGHGGILAVSAVLGFGAAALAIIVFSDVDTMAVIAAFSGFIGSAILLGWIFIALAFFISVAVAEKSKAAGLALVLWFLFVLVFDLVLMAILVGSEGGLDRGFLSFLLLLNPTDIFRLINYLIIDAQSYGGVLQVAEQSGLTLSWLFGLLLIWIACPLILALMIFKRRKL